MKRWPIIVAVLMMAGSLGVLQSWSHAEPVLSRKSFVEFPLTLSDRWKGTELGLERDVLDVLKLTDYMMRVYVPVPGFQMMHEGGAVNERAGNGQLAGGEARSGSGNQSDQAPVALYVGYYQSQRTGATYHSPKNCLPGSGWQFMESAQVPIRIPDGPQVTINKVLIQKGLDKQVILYWYQDRGRIIASEYWAKAYLIWDAITRNRTDGALVRISVPVERSNEQAFVQAVEFMREIFPRLHNNLPS